MTLFLRGLNGSLMSPFQVSLETRVAKRLGSNEGELTHARNPFKVCRRQLAFKDFSAYSQFPRFNNSRDNLTGHNRAILKDFLTNRQQSKSATPALKMYSSAQRAAPWNIKFH